ncbi:MAG: PQQ-like beta-propeller repeat protein [Bacteroidales bacterium]|jgi:outer membrane protein assembly factor BamB|nr:PQQ-like beta-propeller repeat protein [Bacteroidales bacterium]
MKTKRRNKSGLSLIAMLIMFVISGMESEAQDWPQWRGPDRDGISKETGLNLDWSESKPPLLWVFKQAGSGYSSPSIVGTTLYCQGAADDNDFAFALDTKTGNLKWKQSLGKLFVMDRGNGPRGTVTVDGDKLYLIRGGGQLHCLSAADGKLLWQKDFRTDFGGNIMSNSDWGFSESPLVDGDLVICTPGGDGGTMIALNKNTGDLVWRSTEWKDMGGYSSPIVAEVDGIRQYIQLARNGVAGIAAKDGKLLWSANVGGNRTAAIPTPIYHDHMVYVTSGYNAGCAGLRLAKDGDKFNVETVYTNRNMSNHHGGVVLVGDHIYGYSDGPGWVCQNLGTGETVWKQRISEPGKGAVTSIGSRLLCLDERTGSLTVVSATPDGWKEFGRLEIPERSEVSSMDKMVWTHPVIANGKLYIRDHDLLFCFDLKNNVL